MHTKSTPARPWLRSGGHNGGIVPAPPPQSADAVFMVRPARFGFNAETAASNAFQSPAGTAAAVAVAAESLAAAARAEFDAFVRQLAAEGVQVVVGEDSAEPRKPDAVFPNNWVSFHADGTLVLYPMLAPNRRLERRAELVDQVIERTGFVVRRRLDLTAHERAGRILEGTGSLVLDHVQRVAYAVPSSRTDAALVRQWCEAMGYQPEIFAANDARGQPYYHSNVVLSVGTQFAVLVGEALAPADRERVVDRLARSGRAVIDINRAQANEFCANVLELGTWDEALGDSSVLALSQRARAAFTAAQLQQLEAAVDVLIAVPLPVIENVGGGGARCMLAEVFRSR